MNLGIVEGYFGMPWAWPERNMVMRYLARFGYKSFLYAPKADRYLRRDWMELYPKEDICSLREFSVACERHDVEFGVGLSPYELYKSFDGSAKSALRDKISQIEDLGIKELSIFFDDMHGHLPDLADRQIEILDYVANVSFLDRLSFCPSYYSDDVVLDRVFGERPEAYLYSLGRDLSPNIEIIWTGAEVCSRDISTHHIQRVRELLRRKPVLWDNYPVNDGPTKSQYLHLRGFTGRSPEMAVHIDRHLINPALQPHLTLIPALTLVESYNLGDAYCYMEATKKAAVQVLGESLAQKVMSNLTALNDTGRDRLGDRLAELKEIFSEFQQVAADDLLLWLNGYWHMSGADMELA
ncbi:MAG: protein O-GlcNAcase [Puniceicoccaceae bacterium]|jgi:hyaluronoglucosaminidase|nr:protein O-GlcNAcase [Puniceicoccaceae bacterium]